MKTTLNNLWNSIPRFNKFIIFINKEARVKCFIKDREDNFVLIEEDLSMKHKKNCIAIIIEVNKDKRKDQLKELTNISKKYPLLNNINVILIHRISENKERIFFNYLNNDSHLFGVFDRNVYNSNPIVEPFMQKIKEGLKAYRIQLLYENPACASFSFPLKTTELSIINYWPTKREYRPSRIPFIRKIKLSGIFLLAREFENNDEEIYKEKLFPKIFSFFPKPNRIIAHLVMIMICLFFYSLFLTGSFYKNKNLILSFREMISDYVIKEGLPDDLFEKYKADVYYELRQKDYPNVSNQFCDSVIHLEKGTECFLVSKCFYNFSKNELMNAQLSYCDYFEKNILEKENITIKDNLDFCRSLKESDSKWEMYCSPYKYALLGRIEILDHLIEEKNLSVREIEKIDSTWRPISYTNTNIFKLYYYYLKWKQYTLTELKSKKESLLTQIAISEKIQGGKK